MSQVSEGPRSLLASLSAAQGDRDPVDQDIASLFRELRRFLGWPVEIVAKQLGTRPDVILALERGQLARLPSWPETSRIVIGYTALAGVPCQPVLDRLQSRSANPSPRPNVEPDMPAFILASARGPEAQPRRQSGVDGIAARLAGQATDRTVNPAPYPSNPKPNIVERLQRHDLPPPEQDNHQSVARYSLSGRFLRSTILVAAVLAALIAVAPASVIRASADRLPDPVSSILRALSHGLSISAPALPDSHQWIVVEDPRSRRQDKLPPNQP